MNGGGSIFCGSTALGLRGRAFCLFVLFVCLFVVIVGVGVFDGWDVPCFGVAVSVSVSDRERA